MMEQELSGYVLVDGQETSTVINHKVTIKDKVFNLIVKEANKIIKKNVDNIYFNERVVQFVGNDLNKLYGLLSRMNNIGKNVILFSMDDNTNTLLIGACGDITLNDWLMSVIDCLNSKEIHVYKEENVTIIKPIDNVSAIKDIDLCYTASVNYLKNHKLVDFGEDDDTDYAAMYESIGMEW